MGMKITHSGSLGLSHSITLSDEVIAHARFNLSEAEKLYSDAVKALKNSCEKYYNDLLDETKHKNLNNLSIDDVTDEVEGAIKKWYTEQHDKISNINLSRPTKNDIDTLKNLIKGIKNGTISPGKDIRMTMMDGQYYASNKKYSQNKPMVKGGRNPRIIHSDEIINHAIKMPDKQAMSYAKAKALSSLNEYINKQKAASKREYTPKFEEAIDKISASYKADMMIYLNEIERSGDYYEMMKARDHFDHPANLPINLSYPMSTISYVVTQMPNKYDKKDK